MRKPVILECGGYDESLQGCEDLKLYTAIAERHHYAVVPEHLTGYRQTPGNLTSDVAMIRRSADVVLAQFARLYPQFHPELHALKCDLYHWLLRRGSGASRLSDTLQIARALWRHDRRFAVRSLTALPADWLMSLRRFRGRALQGRQRRGGALAVLPDFLADQVQT
jgi:hypothetical protein